MKNLKVKTIKRLAMVLVILLMLGFGINYIFLTTHISPDEVASIYVYHTENGVRIREYSIDFTDKKLYTFESTNGENRDIGQNHINDGYQGVIALTDEQIDDFIKGANSCAFFNWKLRYVNENIADTSGMPQWGVEIKYVNSGMSKTLGIEEYPSSYDKMKSIAVKTLGVDIF